MNAFINNLKTALLSAAFAEEGEFETARQMLRGDQSSKQGRPNMKILVVYDGTISAQYALRHGIRHAKERGGRLAVLYVFNRCMFIDYDAGPRAEEVARSEALQHLEDAQRILRDEAGSIPASVILVEGNPEEEIVHYAREEKVDIIVSPQNFGAVAKISICPVYLIPSGTVPLAVGL